MRNRFLNKLKSEEKLNLVEPSQEICDSYMDKSANCLRSAKLLSENGLYENSVSMSYYAMYDSLIALLFRVGIKCENHGASILLLKLLFGENDLSKLISDAKKERIDKQYYVKTGKDEISNDTSQELVNKAEEFALKIKMVIKKLDNDSIEGFRKKIVGILDD